MNFRNSNAVKGEKEGKMFAKKVRFFFFFRKIKAGIAFLSKETKKERKKNFCMEFMPTCLRL